MDEPMSGLEKVIWWTEYVIRNKGAAYLRSVAADTPYWKYLLLDVVAALLIVAAVLYTIVIISNKHYNYIKQTKVDKVKMH